MRIRAALSGVLAAAAALGLAELLAGIVRDAPSLVATVGDEIIDVSPRVVVRFGIDALGTNDKPALIVGIVVVSLLLGVALGLAGLRRRWVPVVGFAAFAALGVWAAARQDFVHTGWAAVTAVVAAVTGLATLRLLLPTARAADASADGAVTADGTDVAAVGAADASAGEAMNADGTSAVAVSAAGASASASGPLTAMIGGPAGRRQFLLRAGAVGAVAAVAPVLGRRLNGRFAVEEARSAIDLSAAGPTGVTTTVAPESGLSIDGLSPLYTPNDDFYRIDTALLVPQVQPDDWTLRITGEVDQVVELTLDDLIEAATEEVAVTLACVSNPVGGGLIGNARWLGVPLAELLDRAGPTEAAEQVVGRSVDGFTAGFPIELAYDGRPALVAVGMNGEPLPVIHGFPARLVVSGVYGYVSATKWLSEIQLTRWDAVDGYWIPRGWSKLGPIKTQSRIDVPRAGSTVPAGPVAVAGVAWAQTRGISRVEVSIDDGEWLEAELGDALLSDDTWRQWVLSWDATPGSHQIRVRATDGTGETQVAERTPVAPDGATGYHTIGVEVSGT